VAACCTFVLLYKAKSAIAPSELRPAFSPTIRGAAACALALVGCGALGLLFWALRPRPEMTLAIESTSVDSEKLTVRFSLFNKSLRTEFTVTDMKLVLLLTKSQRTPNYVVPRLDLGAFAVTGGKLLHPVGLAAPDISLWRDDAVLKLEPRKSDALKLELFRPRESPQSLLLIMAVAAECFDQTGEEKIIWSDKMYQVSTDDVRGFVLERELPLNDSTVRGLRAHYGQEFRLPAEKTLFPLQRSAPPKRDDGGRGSGK
jgi:hypothetical protein